MPGWSRILTVSVVLLLAIPGIARAADATQEDSPTVKEIKAMHWMRSGDLHFDRSHSTLSLPAGFAGVAGGDAVRFDELINGSKDEKTEGILLSKNDDTVFFQFIESGYVTIDDWESLDPTAMINSIRENTEESNAVRRQHGLKPLHVKGWLHPPSFDRPTKTVFWAISIDRDNGSALVNSVALRLGRTGYEKIIWAAEPEAFTAAGGTLDPMLRAHSYDAGQRYEDHAAGDKLAGYGVAALVGAVAGAKLAKVAAAGGALLLFKKFWFLVLAPIALFYRKIKNFFGATPPAPPTAPSA